MHAFHMFNKIENASVTQASQSIILRLSAKADFHSVQVAHFNSCIFTEVHSSQV